MPGGTYPGSGYPGSYRRGTGGTSIFTYVGTLETIAVGLQSGIQRQRRRRVAGGDAIGVYWEAGPVRPYIQPQEFEWVSRLQAVGYRLDSPDEVQQPVITVEIHGTLGITDAALLAWSDVSVRYLRADTRAKAVVAPMSLGAAYGYHENTIGRDDEDLEIMTLLDTEDQVIMVRS